MQTKTEAPWCPVILNVNVNVDVNVNVNVSNVLVRSCMLSG